jgi:hypothetical protein
LKQARIPEGTVSGMLITLDDAVTEFDRQGLHRGYAVSLP